MSTYTKRVEAGFSTVELLISLFIAAAFIATGFQLFSAVTKDSNEVRLRATAYNLATEGARKHASLATTPCAVAGSGVVDSSSLPTNDLPLATGDFRRSCPYGTDSNTTRITYTVTYGDPQRKVEVAIDVSP